MDKIPVTTLRFSCLAAAIAVYALLGSPTPDAPGLVEIIVAGLLIIGVGVTGLSNAIMPRSPDLFWMSCGRLLLFYGFSIVMIAAALRGHGPLPMLRDTLPFLFLLLPLFMQDIFEKNPEFIGLFIKILIFSGIIFSARAAPEIIGGWAPGTYGGELFYFANAPSVLFAALFLAGFGSQEFVQQFSRKGLLIFIVCFALAIFPLAALALTLQRASLAVFAAGLLLIIAVQFYRYPFRAMLLAVFIAAAILPIYSLATSFSGLLSHKTAAVGLNMRMEELSAAWNAIASSPVTLFFGTGWGGTFESPAVGGLNVNYTHSLLSAMLLKTGLCGLLLICGYLAGLAAALPQVFRRNMALAVAVSAPVMIDVFFYASYKSFDFGLLLLLAASAPALKVASSAGVLYSKS